MFLCLPSYYMLKMCFDIELTLAFFLFCKHFTKCGINFDRNFLLGMLCVLDWC